MKKNFALAGIVSAVAAIMFLASVATYAYPGDGARLMAIWQGLDFASVAPYPLMAVFAKLLGAGNAIAPISGALAAFLLFVSVSWFMRWRISCCISVQTKQRCIFRIIQQWVYWFKYVSDNWKRENILELKHWFYVFDTRRGL